MLTFLFTRGGGMMSRRLAATNNPVVAATGIRTMAVTPRSAKTPDDPDALEDNILPVRISPAYHNTIIIVVVVICRRMMYQGLHLFWSGWAWLIFSFFIPMIRIDFFGWRSSFLLKV